MSAEMDALGWIATVLTILYFLINAGEVIPIMRLGKVEQLSVLPFISAFTNAVLWTKYGLWISDVPIIIVNAFGIATSLWALAMFHRHSGDRCSQVENELSLHLFGLVCFFTVLQLGLIGLPFLSITACGSSIMMYAAPLASLRRVIQTGDTAGSLSPRLVTITIAVCFTWLLYGLQINDYYVIIPNLIGTAIAAVQGSVLYWCDWRRKRSGSLKTSNSIYELLTISAQQSAT